jgi:hypothetical protein
MSAHATVRVAMLALSAAIAACADDGCADGAPAARGFASRQLLAMREPSLRFYSSRGTGQHVRYRTGGDELAPGAPERYWSVNVETGEIREHEDEMFTDLLRGSVTTNGRFTCELNAGATGEAQLVVTDTQSGRQATITGVGYLLRSCPREADGTLTIWRLVDGGVSLWTGPFDALAPARLDRDLVVAQVVTVSDSVSHVVAATPDQPQAFGMYRIDLTSFAVTTVVPAALVGGGWAPGTAAAGTLESNSLVAPIALTPSTLYPQALGQRFIYQRAMSDGGTTTFVGPYAEGPTREVALVGRSPSTNVTQVWLSGPGPISATAWEEYDASTSTSVLRVYDDSRRQVAGCDVPPGRSLVGAVGPDGADVLISPRQYEAGLEDHQLPGPVLLVDPSRAAADGSGGCTVLAAAIGVSADRSPDGKTLSWLIGLTHVPITQLWIAGRDGSAPRLVGNDEIAGPPSAPRFVGDNQLQFKLSDDLVWIDVRDDPVRMNYITERVFGAAVDIGRWLVTGHTYSNQDATGRLSVVNRDTGEALLISPEVERYASPDQGAYQPLPPDRVVRVVYVVRGRNPSPQDGLWLATVDGAALPSR